MALCGHITTASNRTEQRGVNGWAGTGNCYVVMRDWQFLPHGGDGWIALITFFPKKDKIHMISYSTYTGLLNKHWQSEQGYSDSNVTEYGYPYELWLDYDMDTLI